MHLAPTYLDVYRQKKMNVHLFACCVSQIFCMNAVSCCADLQHINVHITTTNFWTLWRTNKVAAVKRFKGQINHTSVKQCFLLDCTLRLNINWEQ